MDNILQFPKVESNSKDEIRSSLINNLVENGASKERADLIAERMSPFLDILCSFEFHPDFPENPKTEDYNLLFKQISEKSRYLGKNSFSRELVVSAGIPNVIDLGSGVNSPSFRSIWS